MNVVLIMTNMSVSAYFDAAALFKYYRDEKGSLNIRRLVTNGFGPIVLSPITVLEFISVLMKCYRKGQLKKKGLRNIIKRLRRDTGHNSRGRPFTILAVPDGSFKKAEIILLQYATLYGISANDSLHLAIAQSLSIGCVNFAIVTSDHSMKDVCIRVGIPFYDPEAGPLKSDSAEFLEERVCS